MTLRFERGTAWAADIIEIKEFLSDVAQLARRLTRDDATAWEDKALRREVGHLAAEADALWALMKWQLGEIQKTGIPGLGGSTLKLAFTELNQRVYELGTKLLGRAGLARDDVAGLPSGRVLGQFLQSLSLTIAAGSSQVQRNIISAEVHYRVSGDSYRDTCCCSSLSLLFPFCPFNRSCFQRKNGIPFA